MFNCQAFPNTLKKHYLVLKIRALLFAKIYDEASVQIEKAIVKWPDDLNLLGLAQEVYDLDRNWDAFYKIYEKLEKVHPNKLQIELNFGSALLGSNRYEDALPKLIFSVENWNLESSYFRNLANTHARLAICYGYLGRWELLEKTLQKAEKIGQWDPDMAYARLLHYIGTNNSEKIPEFLDEQINKYPKLHALYYWKGLYTQYYLHDVQGSLQWYESALEKLNYFEFKRPHWNTFLSLQYYASPWEVLKQSIEASVRLGNPKKALSLIHVSKFRMLYNVIDIQILKAYFDILNKSFDAVEKKCKSMLKKNLYVDKEVEYWLLLALAQSNQENFDDALSSVRYALALNLEVYKTWSILGQIQLQKKDWASAIKTCQRMIQMNRFDFRAWRNLGLCFTNVEDLSSAKASYEQAVQINPFEADIWIDLGKIYLNLKNDDLALSAFQCGLKYDWLDENKRQQTLRIVEQLM